MFNVFYKPLDTLEKELLNSFQTKDEAMKFIEDKEMEIIKENTYLQENEIVEEFEINTMYDDKNENEIGFYFVDDGWYFYEEN